MADGSGSLSTAAMTDGCHWRDVVGGDAVVNGTAGRQDGDSSRHAMAGEDSGRRRWRSTNGGCRDSDRRLTVLVNSVFGREKN
jgi:hypothetical protein